MRYTKNSGYASSLKARTAVCAVALAVLCGVRFTPDDKMTKTKNAVKLILTQQTYLKSETEKIKNIFINSGELDGMNPVAEIVNPVPEGKIAVSFGAQDAADSDFHYGMDIKTSENRNVSAAASGKVTEIATNDEYGTYMIITHSGEISTLYAQLNEILPDVGESVTAGQPIAKANADNGMVHFEIRRGETYLNPSDFIDFGE